MDITSLELECDSKGNPKVSVWAKCHTPEDVEDIIAWLHLAKDMMRKWDKIRGKRAPASHTPKATSGKNENPQPRQVQGKPQSEVGSDGEHPEQANAGSVR